MTRSIRTAVLLTTMFSAVSVFAQATRTWVSGVGDDANPCSRTAPCKTFAGAISKTAPAGEINVIDPGGFGAVTITKAITIDGGGGFMASVLNPGNVNGIVIVAASTDQVILRNLTINGGGSGLNGIRILSAKSVQIENCSISRQNNRGIDVAPTTVTQVVLNNTVLRDNVEGLGSFPQSGGSVNLTLNNVVSSANSGHGIDISVNTKVQATHCTFTNNGASGLISWGPSDDVSLDTCVLSGNNYGVYAGNPTGTNTTVRLSDCLITGNTNQGVFLNGGTVYGYRNNTIDGNGGGNVVTSSITQQ